MVVVSVLSLVAMKACHWVVSKGVLTVERKDEKMVVVTAACLVGWKADLTASSKVDLLAGYLVYWMAALLVLNLAGAMVLTWVA